MTNVAFAPIYPPILNLSGGGLNNGQVYIGVANMDARTNPIPVFWDKAGTIAASQPLSTIGGYISYNGSPATIYAAAPYSVQVFNKEGVSVYYVPDSSKQGGDTTLRSDLADDEGSTFVTNLLPYDRVGYAGAVGRPMSDKLGYDLYSLLDFVTGPIELANPFDVLNLATGADQTYSGNNSTLAREIRIPGNLTFPGQNRSVFVRKGQTLNFLGGREHDLSALVSSTVPAFIVGTKSDGTPDAGGLPPRITGLRSLGGPAVSSVIRCEVAGYFIDNIFMTAPGAGMYLGGSDGIVDQVVLDQALVGIQLTGSNVQIGSTFFFNANYDVQVLDGCIDCAIDRIHSEYSQTNSVALLAGASIKGFRIGTHKALLNNQYAGHTGFLRIDAASSDTLIGVAEYRNGYGAAIQSSTGTNTLVVGYMLADGLKTNAAYTQSSTMGALAPNNMDTTIRSFDFRYLPGQPVSWSGLAATGLRLNNGRFNACTGGSVEVAISKPNGGTFRYSNVETARTLYTAGGGGATIVVA